MHSDPGLFDNASLALIALFFMSGVWNCAKQVQREGVRRDCVRQVILRRRGRQEQVSFISKDKTETIWKGERKKLLVYDVLLSLVDLIRDINWFWNVTSYKGGMGLRGGGVSVDNN